MNSLQSSIICQTDVNNFRLQPSRSGLSARELSIDNHNLKVEVN